MATVTNPLTRVTTPVLACRVCQKPVYFGFTAKGKRCPYDIVNGEPTTVSHFTTCERIDDWRSRPRGTA